MDFSSWSAVLSTIASLLLMTLMMMGIRLLFMQTIQKRRERENRQINERLKTLMAAYKVLGGSFTGSLTVNPVHLRDLVRASSRAEEVDTDTTEADDTEHAEGGSHPLSTISERHRQVRDAVEAALSDIILLGTEDQVRMAAQAAQDMVQGRHIETAALVASLRTYIREALDLEAIPDAIRIPNQGPTRPNSPGAARRTGANTAGARAPGAAGGRGAGGGGGGMGTGMGLGMGSIHRADDV